MKRILSFVLAILFLLSACSAEQGIIVHNAWMRPARQGENGAVYFMIENNSRSADELLRVSSEVAKAVEIHESSLNGDVMEMHQMHSVPLETSAQVEFAPGGLHVMLVGLEKDLNLGDEIELTLHFRGVGDLKVRVPVQDSPAAEEDH